MMAKTFTKRKRTCRGYDVMAWGRCETTTTRLSRDSRAKNVRQSSDPSRKTMNIQLDSFLHDSDLIDGAGVSLDSRYRNSIEEKNRNWLIEKTATKVSRSSINKYFVVVSLMSTAISALAIKKSFCNHESKSRRKIDRSGANRGRLLIDHGHKIYEN